MPSSLCEVCLPAKVKDRSNKRHPAAAVRVCLAGLSTDLYLPSPPCPTGARPVRVPLPGLGRRCPDLSGCVRVYPLSPGPWPLTPGPWPLPGPAAGPRCAAGGHPRSAHRWPAPNLGLACGSGGAGRGSTPPAGVL